MNNYCLEVNSYFPVKPDYLQVIVVKINYRDKRNVLFKKDSWTIIYSPLHNAALKKPKSSPSNPTYAIKACYLWKHSSNKKYPHLILPWIDNLARKEGSYKKLPTDQSTGYISRCALKKRSFQRGTQKHLSLELLQIPKTHMHIYTASGLPPNTGLKWT